MTQLTTEQGVIFAQIAIKLKALNIAGSLLGAEAGPIVTTYYLSLDSSTPIAKILKAEEDIALATQSASVLITRKEGKIAIAIPNKERQIVSFDDCLHSIMQDCNTKLPILLGVDTKGVEKHIDLTELPHILLAGSTGAGKSVLLSAIISGLVTAKSSKQCKLILVDTKQLDLTLFNSLPHVVQIADSLVRAHEVIDRLHVIVRQRTEKMKGLARNLHEYNSLSGDSPLPYYVVIIDELADVLMLDRSRAKGQRGYEKFEQKLQGLLQICRATGVHVICATQRPSVEIITGDIKANLPTRIALRLPSGADSRTIINEYGAENLLGKGDMLCESPIFDSVTRFHGPFVSLAHIARIVSDADQIRDSYRRLQLQ